MPILLKPNESDPLSQGDVLVGLRLYSTSANWDDSGGPPEWEQRYGLCLVVSRPCVIAHKGSILVAAVHAVREAPPVPRDAGYEEVKLFLMKLRDGAGRPDRFYLGGVPGQPSGRYYAHLDSIHSVLKPPESQLAGFLKNYRVARLSDDFVRDLHVRLFASVANLGFDDAGWLPDADLSWLIEAGRKELIAMTSRRQDLRIAMSSVEASGEPRKEQQIANDKKALTKLEGEISDFQRELESYEAEARARDRGESTVRAAHPIELTEVDAGPLEDGERLL